MQYLDLPLLLSRLRKKQVLTAEQMERLENEAHSVVERTGYLLQYVRKLQQRGVDMFLECLRESSQHKGHREIVDMLEEFASEVPQRSPLLEVFQTKQSDIVQHLSFPTFVNKMGAMGFISVHENMDINNPHRSSEENILALIQLLQRKPGALGLLNFIECLQEDPNPGHETLCQVLLEEARAVTQQHPLRTTIPQADQIALGKLERWREVGTPTDIAIREAFSTHEAKLAKQLQVASLLPYLLKHHVVTSEDQQQLNQLPVGERAVRLVKMVRERGARAMAGFVDCLRESPDNRSLAMLFEMAPAKAVPPKTSKKTSKLAVLITMDTFIILKNDYEADEDNMSTHNKHFEEHRGTLKLCLERLGFSIVDFGADMSRKSEEFIGGITASNFDDLFQENVVARCNQDAIVFIYMSGIQFPSKSDIGYSAAVLKDGASEVSRRTSECLLMKDISHWVELLPTSYVTFLIDTHQSHIVTYGKQRQPAEVEIMENPWPSLSSPMSGAVLFFVRPDPRAMWTLRGRREEKKSVFGHLTEIFAKTLVSWIRRGQKEEVSHRLFYESISFHWHKKGRVHKLFVPAVQGDVDRSFLGKTTHPYQQVIRADLLPAQATDTTTPQKRYNLQELQVATGSMMGLIRGDELEVFHVLHPELRVGGRVTKAYPLSALAEVKEEDRERFGKHLAQIYEEEPMIRDGSTEFVFVKKRFPLHQREDFAVGCDSLSESETETIKQYVRESSMLLSYAPKTQLVRLMVRKEGQFFTVEDRGMRREGSQEVEEDIRYKPRARSIQHVKSVLEIMAWFKYVKFLRTQTSASFLCFLTCEKPLLSRPSLDVNYQIRCSSHVGTHLPSEAILQFSDDPKFWIPNDPAPALEVVFTSNRVVTALEVRGDSKFKESHMKKGVLNYRKLVFSRTHRVQQPQGKAEVLFSCHEPAMFVTLTPLDWTYGSDFCIALSLHMTASGQEGGKQRTKGVSSLFVMHWQYLRDAAQWRITPQPSEAEPVGQMNLSHTGHWLQWSGKTNHFLTFDLGGQIVLEKMEIACVPGTNPLQKFKIELHNHWLEEKMPTIPSVWPFKYELSRPLVVSNLQLCPLDQQPVHLQLQLYGNREEKLVSVEDSEILTLHFVNFTEQLQFVYLYYLEETGKVEFVIMDVVQPKRGLKKLLRAHLPQGYDPPTKQITDIYQVLVSPKKMYLEPLRQLGLHEYHTVHSYNLCSLGRRTDIGKDEQWYQYKFTVIVKKGSHRDHQ